MDISLEWVLKITLFVGLLYVALSLFNVQWLMRLRIIGSLFVGILILGVLGWPLVRPGDPLAPVTFLTGQIGPVDLILALVLAFLSGALGCLVAYPFGKEVGLLAAPAGMAYWAVIGGNMRVLLLTHSPLDERLAAYGFLKWENFFWFVLVAAGGLGAWAASRLIPSRDVVPQATEKKQKLDTGRLISMAAAVVVSVVAAQFIIRFVAQNVRYQDVQLGSVIGQPGNLQIALAVFVAFLAAAFLSSYFLNVGYVVAALSAPILGFYIIQTACTPTVLEYMTNNWAVTYFPNALCAILPIQLISFAAIGSITGYWIGVRYRKPKTESQVP